MEVKRKSGKCSETKKPINEELQINTITRATWTTYFKTLYQDQDEDIHLENNNNDTGPSTLTADDEYNITLDDVKRTIINSKNRKTSELDGITNEMLKYGGSSILHEVTNLFKNIMTDRLIP